MGGMPGVYVPPREPLRTLTWMDVGILVAEIMVYLQQSGFKKGDRAAIFSWNCPEWIWTDLAIQSLGGVSVPIYPNYSGDQVNFILENSGSTFIFSQTPEQLALVNADSDVRKVLFEEPIYNLGDYHHTNPSYKEELSIVTRALLRDLEDEVREPNCCKGFLASEFASIQESDIATLIYTSGSTGIPKGVILTHGNIEAAVSALLKRNKMVDSDVYLSYLPMAHVYERVNGQYLRIAAGIPSGYSKVDPEELAAALLLYRPTILLGVPAVWRKFRDRVNKKLAAGGFLKKRLVAWALAQKTPGWKHSLADYLVFRKVRAGFGGRLRLGMSGGAATAIEILAFFNFFGIPLREGYGLTETCGGIALNTLEDNVDGSVGVPLDNVEVTIVPEEGYEPHLGVIWLKGGPVTPGYWNAPEENAKSFDGEGRFNTGDIGYMKNGRLYIVTRKKRLIKTDQGKYVAPDKVEKAFDGVALIQALVPVGDNKPFIGALVFINQAAARELVTKSGGTLPAGDQALFFSTNQTVLAELEKARENANRSLERWETVKKCLVVPVEATVANGLLTPTLKVRVEEVLKRYSALLEQIYAGH